jgi:hypothetical protein
LPSGERTGQPPHLDTKLLKHGIHEPVRDRRAMSIQVQPPLHIASDTAPRRDSVRIGIAKIMQETSTFSTQPTDLSSLLAYGVVRGQEAVSTVTMWDEFVAGFLDAVGDLESVGVTKVTAMPAGNLTPEAHEAMMGWFEEDLRNALPLDGLLPSLHGASAGDLDADIDGLVMQRARSRGAPATTRLPSLAPPAWASRTPWWPR